MRTKARTASPPSRFAFAALAVLAVCAVPAARTADGGTRTTPVAVPFVDAPDAQQSLFADPNDRPFLGVVTTDDPAGLRVRRVVPSSAAAEAGLRIGDLIVAAGGERLRTSTDLRAKVRAVGTGAALALRVTRDGRYFERAARIGRRVVPSPYFRGAEFRLLVVPLAFADESGPLPGNDEIEQFYFRRTGRRGAGASMRDYFDAQSVGRLDLRGTIAPTLTVSQPRAAYTEAAMGAGPGTLYAEAAGALSQRPGLDVAADYDGIAFLHSGEPETRAHLALWPHRALVDVGGRQLPYFVHSGASLGEGLLGEHCHEFTHLLGIPDQYGIAHLTGCGDFCLMSLGHRGAGDAGPRAPFSLCAHCRVRLGWADVVCVDPAVPQRIRLQARDDESAPVVQIPLTAAREEFLLLETRGGDGFDAELPSQGLFVWRVGGLPTPGQGPYGSPFDLVEAHGIDTFDASHVRTGSIAFPTPRARDLTPNTVPSSRSARRDAFEVHVTDIERLGDGSVAFTVGVPRTVEQAPPAPWDGDLPASDGYVHRVDPITGEHFRFVSTRPRADGDTSDAADATAREPNPPGDGDPQPDAADTRR